MRDNPEKYLGEEAQLEAVKPERRKAERRSGLDRRGMNEYFQEDEDEAEFVEAR